MAVGIEAEMSQWLEIPVKINMCLVQGVRTLNGLF